MSEKSFNKANMASFEVIMGCGIYHGNSKGKFWRPKDVWRRNDHKKGFGLLF